MTLEGVRGLKTQQRSGAPAPVEPVAGGSVPGNRAEPGAGTPPWLRPAAVRLAVLFVLFAGVSALAGALSAAAGSTATGGLLVGLATAAGALGLYAGAVRVVERRRATELSLRAAPWGLGRGALIGVALFAGTIGVITALGGYRVTGWGSPGGAVAALGLMASVAVTEELLFRGVLFRVVEELTGTWGALAVSGVVFGALHLLNPDATAWGALAIAVEAGALLAAAYAATRTLWLPIGLHLGWNWAEGGLFGTVVSGSGHRLDSLLTGATSGPTALSGGSFGPEASLVAVLACSAATLLLLRLAHRRGRIRPRARRSSPPLAPAPTLSR